MKIIIRIEDSLLAQARKLAAREGITLNALIELGLRRAVSHTKRAAPFRLRNASFKGRGLQPEAKLESLDKLRSRAYEGRGG